MNLKLGIFVVLASALLLWATFQSGSFRLGREEMIVVHFAGVGGLEEGAVVRLNGVPVGIVRDISLAEKGNDVAVSLGVKNGTRARLHQGSTARITTVGFLAELYVELSGGDVRLPPIRDDREISVGIVADPAGMMDQAKSMADSLELLVSNLNTTTGDVAKGRGTLGRLARDDRLYEQMVSLTREATALTSRLNENQQRVTERLLSLTASLDSLTYTMQHGEGTMAKLMTSDDLHQHLVASTARLDSILAAVQSGRGTMGKFMADSTLYDNMTALMGSMKRLMAEIEKNPKKYLKFSIF
jgi:phospholipid/cholesterol/gamma-HCH transport system substrate-binding protein